MINDFSVLIQSRYPLNSIFLQSVSKLQEIINFNAVKVLNPSFSPTFRKNQNGIKDSPILRNHRKPITLKYIYFQRHNLSEPF